MAVDFYRHSLGEDEKRAVAAVLDSLFLTTGQRVFEFEKAFEEFLGVPAAVCTAHGTASLHLAMLAAGVGRGDEVVTTPMTFLSSSNAILYAGGTPVFVDVDPATANIDPAAVEAAVTPRTKAIVAVDLYGLLADMKALRGIADRHGLVLVEDAAHCVEGRRDGVGPGQLADFACFSFYATKNLTCGEGGALTARDAAKKNLLRQLGSHGMSKNAAERYAGRYQHWDMERLGFKYNLSDVNASMLVSQLPKLAATSREAGGDLPALRGGVPCDGGGFVPDRAARGGLGAASLHDLGRPGEEGRDPRLDPGAEGGRRRELPRRPPDVVLHGAVRLPARDVPGRRADRRLDDHDPALARHDGRAGGRGDRGRSCRGGGEPLRGQARPENSTILRRSLPASGSMRRTGSPKGVGTSKDSVADRPETGTVTSAVCPFPM